MTKRQKARAGEIIHQLCEMSRDGWRTAKPYDYQPLERELIALLTNEVFNGDSR